MQPMHIVYRVMTALVRRVSCRFGAQGAACCAAPGRSAPSAARGMRVAFPRQAPRVRGRGRILRAPRWGTRRAARILERNKRGCNKRGCKSKKCGNMQISQNLREIGRICAKFARICATLREFAQICELVFAKFTQICAKFTAPFVTVLFVPI